MPRISKIYGTGWHEICKIREAFLSISTCLECNPLNEAQLCISQYSMQRGISKPPIFISHIALLSKARLREKVSFDSGEESHQRIRLPLSSPCSPPRSGDDSSVLMLKYSNATLPLFYAHLFWMLCVLATTEEVSLHRTISCPPPFSYEVFRLAVPHTPETPKLMRTFFSFLPNQQRCHWRT